MAEIVIENVTKKIRGNEVLKNISMELRGPAVVGFSGVNGSGKTMLMRLVSGLILPTEGSVRVDGKKLGEEIEFPENIGILIENPAFLEFYSGFQNLSLLASIQGKVGQPEIVQCIERVGLNPYDKKKYKKYSLGMKQRLGIAAAVLESPALLILDEPVNALDQSGVLMLKDLIRQEKDRGALVILSCHDRGILEELSDEIYELEQGCIVNHRGGS